MTRRRWVVLVSLAALGHVVSCGSTVVPTVTTDTGVSAGTRLRPVMVVAEGVEAFLHWHDTELGFDCVFQRDETGSRRCLPHHVVVFADADCTDPLVLARCNAAPKYAVLTNTSAAVSDACDLDHDPNDGWFRAYRATGNPTSATAYHRGGVAHDGQLSCQGEAIPLVDGEVLLPAEPVALTNFVEAAIVVEEGDDRLGRRLLVAADGATQVWSAFDRELGLPCQPGHFSQGDESRCMPSFAARAGMFADATCNAPAAVAECGHHAFIVEPSGSFCDPPRLYAPGEELATAYFQSNGTCEEASAWPGPFFTVGEPLSPEVLPAVYQPRDGPGRLKTNRYRDVDGRTVGLGWRPLFDAELGEPCVPVDLGEGGLRCLPSARRVATAEMWFADPACTEPVGREPAPDCSPRGRFWWLDPTSCAPYAFDLRASVGLTSEVYARDGDVCAPGLVPEGEVAVVLGPPLSVDDFPLVERVMQ